MSPGQKDIGKFMQRNIPWLQMPDSAFTAFTAAHKLLTSNLRRKIERFVKEAVEVVERFVEENARHFVAVIIVGYDPSIGGTEMLYILLWFERSEMSDDSPNFFPEPHRKRHANSKLSGHVTF